MENISSSNLSQKGHDNDIIGTSVVVGIMIYSTENTYCNKPRVWLIVGLSHCRVKSKTLKLDISCCI